jgi:dihydrolipoamide dehydrogenase
VSSTPPEVANVGKTEEQLKDDGADYKTVFSFMGNGRAKANFAGDGFVKILADKATDRILGAYIIGPMAARSDPRNLWQWNLAPLQKISRTCHAHPTIPRPCAKLPLRRRRDPRQSRKTSLTIKTT